MVWEQGSATIVMLTNLEEKGRVRSNLHLPPHLTACEGVCLSVCVCLSAGEVPPVLARGEEWSLWQDQSPPPGVPGTG